MLKKQKIYLDYLLQLKNEIKSSKISDETKERLYNEFLETTLKQSELLIPVVGAFSAGKSSLINSFLGHDVLPVGITPETSLATEIHFGEKEEILAITKNSSIEKFAVCDIKKIADQSHNYKYLKIYLKNLKIKDIQPLILVDMPGFDSPLDLHNQAIIEYLDKGCHYIVLTSVEDGNITRSMIRQLSDIQEYGRGFTFFLSKSNLRSESDIKEISEKVEEQIEMHLDYRAKVLAIDHDGGNSLTKILKKIDPEKIFENLFLSSVKDYFYHVIEVLNVRIVALKKSRDENLDAIKEMKRGIDQLKQKRNSMLDEAKNKYCDVNIHAIVESVGADLSNSVDELAQSAMRGGEAGLSNAITDIVRHRLIEKIKDTMNIIGDSVVNDLALSLNSINSTVSSFSLNEDWLLKMTDQTKLMMEKTQSIMGSSVDYFSNKANSGKIYKAISTILAVTTTIMNPILELVIIFLPELISGVFNYFNEKKRIEELKNIILAQVVPSIKRQLSVKLPEVFDGQVNDLIKNIAERFETELNEKLDAIEQMESDKQKNISDADKEIKKYENLSSNITGLTNRILFQSNMEVEALCN